MYTYSDMKSNIKLNKLSGYKITYDAEAIRDSLLNIFLIQKGEVAGKPGFGNPINLQVFDLFNFFTRQNMEDSIADTIRRYEPRINLIKVDVVPLPEYNRIIIQISYSYKVDDTVLMDRLDIPYTHNSISYLGGRREAPTPLAKSTQCKGQ